MVVAGHFHLELYSTLGYQEDVPWCLGNIFLMSGNYSWFKGGHPGCPQYLFIYLLSTIPGFESQQC